MHTGELKDFLELSYKELEKLNLEARSIKDPKQSEVKYAKYLEGESRIKAVTVCFSDIEGRLHMIDYNKTYFLNSLDNLTFDGSSIRGFSEQAESDLRLDIDWTSITHLPVDVFGRGKVLIFANVLKSDGQVHESDFRGRLSEYSKQIKAKKSLDIQMAPEIEGFLINERDAEQKYNQAEGFKLVSIGGYYHSLPLDELRLFIDRTAEAQLAMGFKNEKDHAEVAPSQFEINFKYTSVVRACDQIQLYKLICRQVAEQMGYTATFLPKPVSSLNGNGMHINLSLAKNGKNIFSDKKGDAGLSKQGWEFIDKVLNRAPDLCLLANSSVNAYRRLDPNFEAPNQIKASASDRSSMVRIPLASESTTRIEFRSVAPDCNPYMTLFGITKTGLDDILPVKEKTDKRARVRMLPSNMNDAIRIFKSSDYTTELIGEASKQKYVDWKQKQANRNPRELGKIVKDTEILYHHEVTNQYLWGIF